MPRSSEQSRHGGSLSKATLSEILRAFFCCVLPESFSFCKIYYRFRKGLTVAGKCPAIFYLRPKVEVSFPSKTLIRRISDASRSGSSRFTRGVWVLTSVSSRNTLNLELFQEGVFWMQVVVEHTGLQHVPQVRPTVGTSTLLLQRLPRRRQLSSGRPVRGRRGPRRL